MNVLAAGHGWRDLAIWAMPPGCLRPGVRHRHRRGQGLDHRPAEGPERGPGRRRRHTAGDPRRPAAVAPAPRARARLHARRVPRLGSRRVPGRPGPPRPPADISQHRPQISAAARKASLRPGAERSRSQGEGRQDTKTARFLALVAERYGPLAELPLTDVSRICTELAPRPTSIPAPRGPRCAAMSSPCRTGARNDHRFEAYFILLMSALLVAAALRWCFGPHSRLPRFRVRYLRLRLHLRLHPGRGHATASSCGCGGAGSPRSAGRAGPAGRCRSGSGCCCPDEHSPGDRPGALPAPAARAGRGAHLIKAPPRSGKTGLLARIILRYPGPVVSTTTKHDVFELTSGIRSRRGPVHVFNPQWIGGVPSTFRWNPVTGCEDPATAIRRADGFANAVSMTGTEDASFWSSKASQLPAVPVPRRRALPAGTCAWSPGGRSATPSRPRTSSPRRGRGSVGRRTGRAAQRGAEDRRRRSAWSCPGRWRSWPTRPWPAPSCPATSGGVRHRGVPAPVRDAVPDRRVRARRQPGRPAVRRHGRRGPPRRRPARPGHRPAAGSTRRC